GRSSHRFRPGDATNTGAPPRAYNRRGTRAVDRRRTRGIDPPMRQTAEEHLMKITAFIGGFGFPSSTTELTGLIARAVTERTGAPVQAVDLRDGRGDLPTPAMSGF